MRQGMRGRMAARSFRPGSLVWVDFFDEAGLEQSVPVVLEEARPDGFVLRASGPPHQALRVEPGAELTLWQDRHPQSLVAAVRLVCMRPDDPPRLVTTPPARVQTMTLRHFHRVQALLDAYGIDPPGWRGTVLNVSANGCLVELSGGAGPGAWETLQFALQLPGGEEPLVLRGKVVRTVRAAGRLRLGVMFGDVPRRQRERLVEFVLNAGASDHTAVDPAARATS